MFLSVFTSLWVPDISTSIAALGFVALFISNIQLLWLYVVFAPLTTIVDIGQMVQLNHTSGTQAFWFFVLLRTLEMLAKLAGGFFGWQISSSGNAAEAGYETMNNPEPHVDHFPPSYAAPAQADPGPQVQPPPGPQNLSPGV